MRRTSKTRVRTIRVPVKTRTGTRYVPVTVRTKIVTITN